MTYLLATYWFPILLALLVGGVTGFLTFTRAGSGWWPRQWPLWLLVLGAAFVIGVIVALFGWLPDGPGLWLETALLLLAAFFIGLLLGSWLAGILAPAAAPAPVAATPAPVVAPVAEAKPLPVVDELPEVVTAPVAIAEPVVVPVPAAAAPVEGEKDLPGLRPAGFAAPHEKADDLQRIVGIGPKNEGLLHGLGIYYFHQIAAWDADNIVWVNSYLRFKGRIEREDWVGQAKVFAGEK